MNAPAIIAAPAAFVPGAAVTLWLVLVGSAAAVLGLAGALARWQRRQAATPSVWQSSARRLTSTDLIRLCTDVDAISRRALSAAAAAADAEWAMTAAEVHCRDAQEAREQAWHEYDAAQRSYVVALRSVPVAERPWSMINDSAAWPVPAGDANNSPVPARNGALPAAEQAALHHDLSRAALAAFRRGDLTVDQLREVYLRFSGWDHELERQERGTLRRRAAQREAHRRYDAAAVAERVAYRELDIATAAARAWAHEAAETAEEAWIARIFADECLRSAANRRRLRRLVRSGRRGSTRTAPAGPVHPHWSI